MDKPAHYVRDLPAGMGRAVAERTILRKKENGELEDWADLAHRVAVGNCSLADCAETEQKEMEELIAGGALMMAGRHLQQGDENQKNRNGEVYNNCATSCTSFMLFYHLLNGSGVGRSYDDDMMLVTWDNSPAVWCVLDETHQDYNDNKHLSARNARHIFNGSKDLMWYEVADSREGWAKALELIEVAAFEKIHKDKLLVLDFSKVRPKGAKIGGMQNRPSSGPVPLMNALQKIMMIRGAGLPRWKQAMYVDHWAAECVLVGGARRAARIATKYWKDTSILDFIRVKRPVEYDNLNYRGIKELRAEKTHFNFLWSANNSIMVDEEFWKQIDMPNSWASKVFEMATECQYGDGTGEPGFVNVDKLKRDNTGLEDLSRGDYIGSEKYQVQDNTNLYLSKLAKRAIEKKYNYTLNPCGEQTLNILGGYCTLGAVAPYHCFDGSEKDWDNNFEKTVRATVRALIRVNLMDSVYKKEVKRTNRIGVGLLGIHEWLYARFGITFNDAINDLWQSNEMWQTLYRMREAAIDEAKKYSEELGLNVPHTITTVPPAGTIAKLFNLTEGVHLPAMRQYLRWVQFRDDDPLVQVYQEKGYPTKILREYKGHTIVGFPTQPEISRIMPQDKIVTAAEATPEEQYRWLELLEKYWIGENYGSQISYTLKYNPEKLSLKEFQDIVKEWQPRVKVCSIMPQEERIAAEYQPEEPISLEEYNKFLDKINAIEEDIQEDINIEHIVCSNGNCSIEFNEEKGVIENGAYI